MHNNMTTLYSSVSAQMLTKLKGLIFTDVSNTVYKVVDIAYAFDNKRKLSVTVTADMSATVADMPKVVDKITHALRAEEYSYVNEINDTTFCIHIQHMVNITNRGYIHIIEFGETCVPR